MDLIAAIATGSTATAIGIVRVSGDGCFAACDRVFRPRNGVPFAQQSSHKMVFGEMLDISGADIDQGLAVRFGGGHSYTGEDSAEFHCHGSPVVLHTLLSALFAAGARQAQAGEFTKRAFLNGKMDLTEAEAVIDLIDAQSAAAAKNAAAQLDGGLRRRLEPVQEALIDVTSRFYAVVDYPDEDIADFRLAEYADALRTQAKALYNLLSTFSQGQILRQGIAAAIVGKPNVGKSSLLNRLAGFDRAIVTDIPGTTRDMVEESVRVGSLRLRLMDTAGIRETSDTVEALGVERSKETAQRADLVLFVCDGSQPLTEEDREAMDLALDAPNAIAFLNKADLGQVVEPADLPFDWVLPICARDGSGLERLPEILETLFARSAPCDGSILTNPRQYDAIRRAYEAMLSCMQGMKLGQTPDALLTDLEEAMAAMGEVTGATVREDITARIFERFCVGK